MTFFKGNAVKTVTPYLVESSGFFIERKNKAIRVARQENFTIAKDATDILAVVIKKEKFHTKWFGASLQ
jgi:hypothetical protein